MNVFIYFFLPFMIALVANLSVATFTANPEKNGLPEGLVGEMPGIIEKEPSLAEVDTEVGIVENKETPAPTEKDNSPKQQEVATPVIPEKKEAVDFETINTNARKALANILCLAKGGGLLPITGSGVFVSEKGVILTNAHIGQYFLLDNFVDCFVRTGNPAVIKYKASLLYISKKWIVENSKNIVTENPKGTGENDYALLLITKTTDNSQLPSVFPYLEMDLLDDPEEKDPVLVAGYAAGFLGGLAIENNLSILSSINSIENIFTFKTATVDLLSINGSIVSQKGASGGAVVSQVGKLVGIIATATQESETSKRELRAITATHINRGFLEESGGSIPSLFSQNLPEQSRLFNDSQSPSLREILLDEIVKNTSN